MAWKGERQRHSMASRGVRSGKAKEYSVNGRVGFIYECPYCGGIPAESGCIFCNSTGAIERGSKYWDDREYEEYKKRMQSHMSHGQMQQIGTHATTTKNRNGKVVVTYHNTDVVKWNPDEKEIELENGGWFTKTTKDRMNQASNQFGLGYKVVQEDNKWFVVFKDGRRVPYRNGMKFKAQGLAKDVKKSMDNFEESGSETARNVNKASTRVEKHASKVAQRINEGIRKGKKLFNESAENTAKHIKKIGKKIDDDASETAKDINKTLSIYKKKKK